MARSSRRTSRTPLTSKCHLALPHPLQEEEEGPVLTRFILSSTQPPGDLRRGCLGSALSFQHSQDKLSVQQAFPQSSPIKSRCSFVCINCQRLFFLARLTCSFFTSFFHLLFISRARHGRSSPLQGRDLRGPRQPPLVPSLPLPPLHKMKALICGSPSFHLFGTRQRRVRKNYELDVPRTATVREALALFRANGAPSWMSDQKLAQGTPYLFLLEEVPVSPGGDHVQRCALQSLACTFLARSLCVRRSRRRLTTRHPSQTMCSTRRPSTYVSIELVAPCTCSLVRPLVRQSNRH